MIFDKSLMMKLKDFGLNSYESKVWVALLSRGVSTAGELSDIANVPRSRSYDVLESLEKKGFVVMKLGKPIKYIAVPPTEVVERVKKKVLKDAQEDQKILDELKDSKILKELSQLHTDGIETQDPSEITGSVKGRDNVYNHLEYQLKTAKENVMIATTQTGVIRKSKALLRQMKKASDRGVKITIAAPFTNETKEHEKILSKYAEIKQITNTNSRFCIIDDSIVTLMLTDDNEVHPNYDLAVWMNSPYVVNTLKNSLN